MVNIILAFAILWISMFISIKIVNFLFTFGKSLDNQTKTQDKSLWKRIIEAALEYLQWTNLSASNVNALHSINPCEIELEAVSGEAGGNIEGIEESISAIAESVGENIATAIENLSNN